MIRTVLGVIGRGVLALVTMAAFASMCLATIMALTVILPSPEPPPAMSVVWDCEAIAFGARDRWDADTQLIRFMVATDALLATDQQEGPF